MNIFYSKVKKILCYSFSSLRKRVEGWQFELPVWRKLFEIGGIAGLSAMYKGFSKANKYNKWDDWSLTHHSILLIACLIIEHEIEHVVEFGSGYSTVALGEFLYSMGLETQMDSFEHQNQFSDRINSFLVENDKINLHCSPLLQAEDNVFEQMLLASDPYGEFVASALRLPKNRYHETRIRNVFYEFNFRSWQDGTIDLVILDGPSGNGRSLAFPFLKKAMRFPSWVLIDDYLDYPFLDDLKRVFVTKMISHTETDNKEFALVKLLGVKS